MSREGDNVFSKDACLRLELDLPDGQFGPITIDDRGWHEIGRTQFTGIDRLARGIARRKSLGSWLLPDLVDANYQTWSTPSTASRVVLPGAKVSVAGVDQVW